MDAFCSSACLRFNFFRQPIVHRNQLLLYQNVKMELQAGVIIKSTVALNDTIFENAIILITELNKEGAVGFLLNKPFHRKLNELSEFSTSRDFPLFVGGPVDQEHLYFIHQKPDLVPGGTTVEKGIYMGGDFKAAVKYINSKTLTTKDIIIFLGYCGWDTAELEAEITEGSWQIVKHKVDLFDHLLNPTHIRG